MATFAEKTKNEAILDSHRIFLSEEGHAIFQQLLERPPAPPESLKALMRLHDFPMIEK